MQFQFKLILFFSLVFTGSHAQVKDSLIHKWKYRNIMFMLNEGNYISSYSVISNPQKFTNYYGNSVSFMSTGENLSFFMEKGFGQQYQPFGIRIGHVSFIKKGFSSDSTGSNLIVQKTVDIPLMITVKIPYNALAIQKSGFYFVLAEGLNTSFPLRQTIIMPNNSILSDKMIPFSNQAIFGLVVDFSLNFKFNNHFSVAIGDYSAYDLSHKTGFNVNSLYFGGKLRI